ncbi:hypothetical protein PG993_013757 [Apiospora rasikravindrae]|uniref:Uncharacterized protein n=1 Tax=Apiospora rasikravindrae TaxID=990691 RepID=A0ABR1RR32_9PEZI
MILRKITLLYVEMGGGERLHQLVMGVDRYIEVVQIAPVQPGGRSEAVARRNEPIRKIEERVVFGVRVMDDVAVDEALLRELGTLPSPPKLIGRGAVVVLPGELGHVGDLVAEAHGGPFAGPAHYLAQQARPVGHGGHQRRREIPIHLIPQPRRHELVEGGLPVRAVPVDW